MVNELRRAFNKAEKLPKEKQKAIAEVILAEIQWDITFQNSQLELATLAGEGLTEYKTKKTKPLILD